MSDTTATTPLLVILTVDEIKQLLEPFEISSLIDTLSITIPNESLLSQVRASAASADIRAVLEQVAEETEPGRPPSTPGATAPPGT